MDNCIGGNAKSPEVKQNQIAVFNGKLSEVVSTLEDRIDNLEGRLCSILRQEPPCNPCESTVQEALVDLAGDLRNKGDRVVSLIEKVNSILDRIEL